MYHVDHTINRCWRRALSAIEGEIPSSAAIMAAIEAKVTIPKDTQTCVVRLFLENTFLQKLKDKGKLKESKQQNKNVKMSL